MARRKRRDVYPTMVISVHLREGQSILLITTAGGLMLPGPTAQPTPSPAGTTNSPSTDVVAVSEMAISCASAGETNPRECGFTAPAFGTYAFVWASAAAFDIIKIGDDTLASAYVGDRLGMFFTDCCSNATGSPADAPCEFVDAPFVRYGNTCVGSSSTAPIPGGPPAPAPEPEPSPPGPTCVPDPGPTVVCCSLEPVGACQRPCCCTFDPGGNDPPHLEAYCRGTAETEHEKVFGARMLASSNAAGEVEIPTEGENLPSRISGGVQVQDQIVYPGLVVRLDLDQGQRVVMLTNEDGLM